MQHALTIRIVALTAIILSVGVGATSYLGSHGKAEDRAALMHVRAAVTATAAWYQDPYGGHGSYRTLSSAGLMHQAPAVSSKVAVTVLHGGRAYLHLGCGRPRALGVLPRRRHRRPDAPGRHGAVPGDARPLDGRGRSGSLHGRPVTRPGIPRTRVTDCRWAVDTHTDASFAP